MFGNRSTSRKRSFPRDINLSSSSTKKGKKSNPWVDDGGSSSRLPSFERDRLKKREGMGWDEWDREQAHEVSYCQFEGGIENGVFSFMEVSRLSPTKQQQRAKKIEGVQQSSSSNLCIGGQGEEEEEEEHPRCSLPSTELMRAPNQHEGSPPLNELMDEQDYGETASQILSSHCSASLFVSEEESIQNSPEFIPETQEGSQLSKEKYLIQKSIVSEFPKLLSKSKRQAPPPPQKKKKNRNTTTTLPTPDFSEVTFIPETQSPPSHSHLSSGKKCASSQNQPLSQPLSQPPHFLSPSIFCNHHQQEIIQKGGEGRTENLLSESLIQDGFFEGLPPAVVKTSSQLNNFQNPNDWQLACMESIQADRGKNFLFTVPAASCGAKNLITETCLLRNSFFYRKKALLILPSVSLVLEKVDTFQRIIMVTPVLDCKVMAFYGSFGKLPLPKGNQILVTTFERAEGLLNSMIEENRMDEVGVVVVDELHLLEEEARGASLELLLTKLEFSRKQLCLKEEETSDISFQIIGVSATIPNLPELADWLKAKWHNGTSRPVPLMEMVLVDNQLYDRTGAPLRQIFSTSQTSSFSSSRTNGNTSLLALVQEVSDHRSSVLIFCPTKSSTRNSAAFLAENLKREKLDEETKKKLDEILLELKALGGASDIAKLLKKGVGLYHSGLISEERDIVARAYKNHLVRVLCASSLAASANLPCQRVIIRVPRVGHHPLNSRMYRQMVARAERAGVDQYGESILIVTSNESSEAFSLVNQPLPPVNSALIEDYEKDLHPQILRLVLDAIVGFGARTYHEILSYFNTTLHAHQHGNSTELLERRNHQIDWALDYLMQPPMSFHSTFLSHPHHSISFLEKKRIREQATMVYDESDEASSNQSDHDSFGGSSLRLPNSDGNLSSFEWRPSHLGQATYYSSLSPEVALFVFFEIQRARDEGFLLSQDIHACYLLCPPQIEFPIPWERFLQIFNASSEVHRNTAEFIVGGSASIFREIRTFERFVRAKAQQNTSWLKKTTEETKKRSNRLFWAWILSELIQENDTSVVATKYNLDRGHVENLKTQASTFGFLVSIFVNRLGWISFADSLQIVAKRIDFGAKEDVLHLSEIKGIKVQRARSLIKSGFKTIEEIVQSPSSETILSSLEQSKAESPFGIDRSMQLTNIEAIRCNAKELLREKAAELFEQGKALSSLF